MPALHSLLFQRRRVIVEPPLVSSVFHTGPLSAPCLFPPLCHMAFKKRIPTYARTRFGVLYERYMAATVIPYRPNP